MSKSQNNNSEEIHDFIIAGSGAAGLFFALEAAKTGKVLIVTKDTIKESNTRYAQGGIAAVLRVDDDYEHHIRDTHETGGRISDVEAIKVLVHEAPARIRDLMNIGVQFDTTISPVTGNQNKHGLDFTREGGHSSSRILHVGDTTGKAIEEALVNSVITNPNIRIREHTMVKDLLVKDGICFGAIILDPQGEVNRVFTRALVLSTGGVGQLYNRTTNPEIATGDGIAIANRVGAVANNMEFIQFHPTAFFKPPVPFFLISETVRGEGGILLNNDGKRFMEGLHPLKELAPRDIVARAIFNEIEQKGPENVFIDISFKDYRYLQNRFPYIYKRCLESGVDICKEPIPVAPAAHYLSGGVKTDIDGATSIQGLYACGEVSCTGVHGANRLASNSLLESVVFAYRAAVHGDRYIRYLPENWDQKLEMIRDKPLKDKEKLPLPDEKHIKNTKQRIQKIMWEKAGIVRTNQGLKQGFKEIIDIHDQVMRLCEKHSPIISLVELRNLAIVARLVLYFARLRKENLGSHYNKDLICEVQ